MLHLKIGGSTASRTLNCPAWLSLTADIPKRPAGVAAIDGSMHHEVQELCRNEDILPADVLDRDFIYREGDHERKFGPADLDLAEIAYNALEQIMDKYDIDEFMIEPFVEIIPNEAGGSLDFFGWSADGKTIVVADYKFGNYAVSAERNSQFMFYMLAAMTDDKTKAKFKKAERLVLAVIQPKVKGVWSDYVLADNDMDLFITKLHTAIKDSRSDNPTQKAGSHCKYCPYEPYCDKKTKAAASALKLDPKHQDTLSEAMAMVEEVEQWAKSVREEAHAQLERGVEIKGFKIVKKKAVNAWIDPEAAQKRLMTEFPKKLLFKVTEKFITGPQAITLMKGLKKKGEYEGDFDVETLIEKKSPAGTVLVSEDDDREAIVIGATPENLKNLMK